MNYNEYVGGHRKILDASTGTTATSDTVVPMWNRKDARFTWQIASSDGVSQMDSANFSLIFETRLSESMPWTVISTITIASTTPGHITQGGQLIAYPQMRFRISRTTGTNPLDLHVSFAP